MDISWRDISEHYTGIPMEYGLLWGIRIRICPETSANNNPGRGENGALYRILRILIISEYIRPPGEIESERRAARDRLPLGRFQLRVT